MSQGFPQQTTELDTRFLPGNFLFVLNKHSNQSAYQKPALKHLSSNTLLKQNLR